MELMILVGMSGSGKSTVMRALEDLSYMCVDNLPPSMLLQFVNQISHNEEMKKVAVELNAKYYAVEVIVEAIEALQQAENIQMKLVFLDASEEALVSRYKEARRVHPLLSTNETLQDAIRYERSILQFIKTLPDTIVIDTTNFSAKELNTYIVNLFGHDQGKNFVVNFMSFGFKYGMPQDADFVIDVRYLPNPFYIPELKVKTGLDNAVYDYVFEQAESQVLYQKLTSLLSELLSGFEKEGRRHAVIAIGCTGGQHRSVSFARKLHTEFEELYQTRLFNRDIYKNKH